MTNPTRPSWESMASSGVAFALTAAGLALDSAQLAVWVAEPDLPRDRTHDQSPREAPSEGSVTEGLRDLSVHFFLLMECFCSRSNSRFLTLDLLCCTFTAMPSRQVYALEPAAGDFNVAVLGLIGAGNCPLWNSGCEPYGWPRVACLLFGRFHEPPVDMAGGLR
jgi:hypothetical protein